MGFCDKVVIYSNTNLVLFLNLHGTQTVGIRTAIDWLKIGKCVSMHKSELNSISCELTCAKSVLDTENSDNGYSNLNIVFPGLKLVSFPTTFLFYCCLQLQLV
jgi:hypothetical protein